MLIANPPFCTATYTSVPSTVSAATIAAARYARVLSIAGSDSSGGAGIQADLKTFSALGCYGMTAITALTAQNTLGVRAIESVTPAMLQAQIAAVVEDVGVDAVKIGMLPSPEAVRVVARAIECYRLPHVVLDPVMVASSGDQLIASATVQVLVQELFPLAHIVTPNLDEAALLLGRPLENVTVLHGAAQDLLGLGAQAVLLKGGHLPGDWVVDLLALPHGQCHRLESARIVTRNGHGTGCTLSSAIAGYLALGQDLVSAVAKARTYILGAIAAAASVHIGQGQGPLNHGWNPAAQVIVHKERGAA